MQLTINDKKVQLNFGVGFVRELDRFYGLSNQAGFNLGLGLTKAIPLHSMEAQHPCGLRHLIIQQYLLKYHQQQQQPC